MPNRIIKETICTSEEIDSLTDSQEVLFYRLMVNCDDFGLFDGRPKIIASKCYPLKSIAIKDIQAMLGALQAAGLVFVYEVEGRPYIAITSWSKHQQIRAKRAKYPMPECGNEIICNQLLANVHVNQSNPIQSESNPNPIQSNNSALRADDVLEIFGLWKVTFSHDKAKLDDKRKKRIRSALTLGYSVEDLCNAIKGCSMSPYHMGDNANGQRYDSLDLILRDAEKIDQFLGFYRNPPRKPQTQKEVSDSITNKALGLDKLAAAIKARQALSGMLIEGETS